MRLSFKDSAGEIVIKIFIISLHANSIYGFGSDAEEKKPWSVPNTSYKLSLPKFGFALCSPVPYRNSRILCNYL